VSSHNDTLVDIMQYAESQLQGSDLLAMTIVWKPGVPNGDRSVAFVSMTQDLAEVRNAVASIAAVLNRGCAKP